MTPVVIIMFAAFILLMALGVPIVGSISLSVLLNGLISG